MLCFVFLQDGLSSQTFVHIDVEDVNDNAPVFSPEKYVTSVSIHTQPGTELFNIFASDRDSGNNGKITYELLPGDSASLFTVDQSTGNMPQVNMCLSRTEICVTCHIRDDFYLQYMKPQCSPKRENIKPKQGLKLRTLLCCHTSQTCAISQSIGQ